MSIIDKILTFLGMKKKPGKEKPVQIVNPGSTIKNKILYTTTMINSITLSSDMKTLYLIDNGRAISFPIDDQVGILIGKIGDQLSVATAVKPIDTADNADDTRTTTRSSDTGRKVIKLQAAEKSQWTMTYHSDNQQLVIIGTTDIDLSLTQPDKVNCDMHFVDLSNKIVNIRRKEEELELIELQK